MLAKELSWRTVKWLRKREYSNKTDRLRVQAIGIRLTPYFILLDLIRDSNKWVSVGECVDELVRMSLTRAQSKNSQLRQARRIMYTLEAACMVKIRHDEKDRGKTWAKAQW